VPRAYEVEWDGTVVRLPHYAEGEETFASWGRAESELESFAKQVRRRGEKVATVALIPRPDNTYNRFAISVARPAEAGATADERHLGYLHDHFLRGVGMTKLTVLAQYAASGEIECTVRVRKKGHVELAVPGRKKLGRVLDEFLARHPSAPATSEQQRVGWLGESDMATARCLDLMAPQPGAPIALTSADDLRLVGYGAYGRRGLSISDARTGEFVGRLEDRVLTIEDERARPAVVAHLIGLGIDVAAPIGASARADGDEIPRLELIREATHIQLCPRGEDGRPDRNLTVAYYVPLAQTLWVASRRLVDSVRLFAERHGLTVENLHVSLMDWALDVEVDYHDLHGHTAHREHGGHWDPSRGSGQYRLPHLKELLPPELRERESPSWGAYPDDSLPQPENQFLIFEQYFTDRAALFGAVELGDAIVPCRLCGRRSLQFTAACTGDPLAYCDTCRTTARLGWLGRVDDAPIALRALAMAEFAGELVLRQQLDQINAPQDGTLLTATDVDRLLMLRSFIHRNKSQAWTKLLIAAGLADEGIRMSRGTAIPAVDGHPCASMLEKAVDDFLHRHDIPHTREPAYPRHLDMNSNRYRADWQLADGTLVEMWGMPNEPAYAEKMVTKRTLAETCGVPLLEIFPPDVNRLREVFAGFLPSR
jgi:hypothetical protein